MNDIVKDYYYKFLDDVRFKGDDGVSSIELLIKLLSNHKNKIVKEKRKIDKNFHKNILLENLNMSKDLINFCEENTLSPYDEAKKLLSIIKKEKL